MTEPYDPKEQAKQASTIFAQLAAILINVRNQPISIQMVARDPSILPKWEALEKAVTDLGPEYYSMWVNGQTINETIAEQITLAALKTADDGKVN
jgi:hypothetical protein